MGNCDFVVLAKNSFVLWHVLFVSLADRPIVELLLVDPHGSNMCDSLTSSAQHQSERFALFLYEEKQFVEKHLNSDRKNFFLSALRDWFSRDVDKLSAAVSHTWDDTNVSVLQPGQNGAALVNFTCVRESCCLGELTCHNCLKVKKG